MIEATEADVQAAVDRLRSLSLVMESSGGRVMRYAQNVGKVLGIPPQSVALLAVLFLRGPQTAGELRINSERLHKFGDIMSVEAFLHELAEKPYVRELPRQPGARETRWAHLLSGEPSAAPTDTVAAPVPEDLSSLQARVERLEAEVADLREKVARLHGERDRGE